MAGGIPPAMEKGVRAPAHTHPKTLFSFKIRFSWENQPMKSATLSGVTFT